MVAGRGKKGQEHELRRKVEAEKALLAESEAKARSAADKGAIQFFGCSKCRWSRGGCCQCNDEKMRAWAERKIQEESMAEAETQGEAGEGAPSKEAKDTRAGGGPEVTP